MHIALTSSIMSIILFWIFWIQETERNEEKQQKCRIAVLPSLQITILAGIPFALAIPYRDYVVSCHTIRQNTNVFSIIQTTLTLSISGKWINSTLLKSEPSFLGSCICLVTGTRFDEMRIASNKFLHNLVFCTYQPFEFSI